jgi:hypothetical protein
MRRAAYPTKFAESSFSLLLGAVLVPGIDARAAQAFDAVAVNARAYRHQWCVTREGSGVTAACEYDNFLSCSVAAIMASGSCQERLSMSVTAGAVPLPRPRKLSAAKPPLQKRQLKASTALAAADPFTERVQAGGTVLYRARFAGFDKEAAEIACKQLKRGHFECMARKK